MPEALVVTRACRVLDLEAADPKGHYRSPAAAVDAFLTHSGPSMALFDVIAAEDRAQARTVLEAHFADRSDQQPDGIALRADYAVIHLARC